MTPTITKALFIESINAIETQARHDQKCHEAYKVIHRNSHVAGYDHSAIMKQLIKVLQVATNDFDEHSWIDYFIWELDFGKKYRDGCIVIQGSNFELTNANQLWDLLNME